MKTKDEMLEAARKLVAGGDDRAVAKLAGMQLAVLLDIRDLLAAQQEVARTPPIDPVRAPSVPTRVKVAP